jgi:preflagellin peptidase FlaK
LRKAAVLALGLALTAAAWQDVKTREIDVRIFAAAGATAAVLMWLNWGNPLYTFRSGGPPRLVDAAVGAGYADSTALALISTAPPVALLPAPFIAVMAGSVLLPATMLWLYVKNRGRPCRDAGEADPHMRLARGICEKPGEIRRRRRQRPGEVRPIQSGDKRLVEAKYGLPYVFHLAVGFWVYVALFLTTP